MRCILFACLMLSVLGNASSAKRPNVLFIAVDDLNDWVGCLGGHPQALTPNIDRLAASGVLFTNAHCAAPACNPSRTAVMTGISPHVSGVYSNRQSMREVLPDAELIPKYFTRHGYRSAGSGKLLHYFIDAPSWDDYYPAKESEDPFPRTLYPPKRPLSLPRGGPWQYVETDWGPLDATDEEFGGDWLVSRWASEQLMKNHDQPQFIACGIYRPHEPWFVPRQYFDKFPLKDIQLPPGYLKEDLKDLPEAGRRRGPNRYFAHIREHGQWKDGIQGYLASISFADAMVGRVLDALQRGPNRDNTIVVLWSDHGWHLGEKNHWQKYTGWRVCTRVPLIIRVPPGISGIVEGTRAGTICDQPVNLLSLFPTLCELAGIPPSEVHDGPSLVPLLKNAESDWDHVSITHLNAPQNVAISGGRWRYIQYENGDHELYDIQSDPFEWKNLGNDASQEHVIASFRSRIPQTFASYKPPSHAALPALKWHPAAEALPNADPDGSTFEVVFSNDRGEPIRLYRLESANNPSFSGTMEAGWRKPIKTKPGEVWWIKDANDQPLGHFVVGDRPAKATVPNE